MSAVVLVALVNPKSGGNVGSQLLERFKEILDEDKIYNLSNGGPKKALEDHGHKENLRLIGEHNISKFSLGAKSGFPLKSVIRYIRLVSIHKIISRGPRNLG